MPQQFEFCCRRQDNDPTFSELCIRGSQAVLVCMEMCIAAWLHRRVFSYRDYRAKSSTSFLQAAVAVATATDVTSDLKEMVSCSSAIFAV